MNTTSDGPAEWFRPSHAEIRLALHDLGRNGPDEIRVALTSGCEPFEAQMARRMKTRHPALRPAYNTLRRAGARKVRDHLAALDHEGLHPKTRRRRRPNRQTTNVS